MSRIKTEHWETENSARSLVSRNYQKKCVKYCIAAGFRHSPSADQHHHSSPPYKSVSPRDEHCIYISDFIQPEPVHRMEKQFGGRRCSPLGPYLVQARVSVDRGARCFSLDRWRRCWRTRRTRTTRLRTTSPTRTSPTRTMTPTRRARSRGYL